MISKIIITAGIIGMAVAFLYFVVADKSIGKEEMVVENTKKIFIISAALIPAGYALRFLANLLGFGYGKCKKCGKRIPKGEMFCFDHSMEAVRQAQDRTRYSDTKPKPRR